MCNTLQPAALTQSPPDKNFQAGRLDVGLGQDCCSSWKIEVQPTAARAARQVSNEAQANHADK